MRRIVLLAISCLFICSLSYAQNSVLFVTYSSPSQGHSRSITVDHTKIPNTDQTNFPVLFTGTFSYLATVANGGKVTNANGYDITFSTDQAGTSLLNWEIESYNATTGNIAAWIRIPTLSHTTDFVFYLRYGNNTITTFQGNVTGTWNSNFTAVWHMKETLTASGQTVSDATSNGLNILSAGTWAGTQQAAGKIGGALTLLKANSDYLSFAQQSFTTSYTLEGWALLSSADNFSFLFGRVSGGNEDMNWFGTDLRMYNGSSDDVVSGTATSAGAWTHFAITRSGTALVLYQNGVSAGTSANGSNFRIFSALGIQNGTSTKDIKFDEVRISNTNRSADWISAEYNNENSPSTFYTIGAEI